MPIPTPSGPFHVLFFSNHAWDFDFFSKKNKSGLVWFSLRSFCCLVSCFGFLLSAFYGLSFLFFAAVSGLERAPVYATVS